MEEYDVVIIGAGIVGSMAARFLSRYEIRILLVEKEADVCMGTSSANSATIHSGHSVLRGTLKAEMNIKGNPMWETLSGELDFPYINCGDYVIATNNQEISLLEQIIDQGKSNGVMGLSIITGEEMRRREPMITPDVVAAVWATSSGLCNPWAATVAAAENAVMNGVIVMLNTEFKGFIIHKKQIAGIRTTHGIVKCKWVINAAGLFADDVMHKANVHLDFSITPRKGEYFVFDQNEFPVKNLIAPVPNKITKGIAIKPTIDGNVLVGANAQSTENKLDRAVTAEGLKEVWEGASKIIPALKEEYIISTFAGLRANGNARCKNPLVSYGSDFLIEIADGIRGLINIAGIESPGLTAAPAIAVHIIDLLKEAGVRLVERRTWNPIRPARTCFYKSTLEQKKRLIDTDHKFANMVCYCKGITEAEIIAEIRSFIPATTYDAIKRRTWLGTGRCRGSLDIDKVIEILTKELSVKNTDVSQKGIGSEFLLPFDSN